MRLFRRRRWGVPPAKTKQTPPEGWPVYPLLWHPVRTRMGVDQAPEGRVIGVEYSFDYQPSEAEFQEALGPNDVVWVPLYRGTISPPPTHRDERRKEYAANLRAIEEIAPRVAAVLVGNANAEIHYEVGMQEEFGRVIRFVEDHGARIRPHGRPAFAPIFEILVHDCYHAGGKLRDILNDMDALVLSYAGCQWLFERPHPKIPEERPFPTLAAYIGTLTAWSGVGLQRGLDHGTGEVLKTAGYQAGFMGYY